MKDVVVLIGAGKHIEEAVSALEIKLDDEFVKRLEAPYKPHINSISPGIIITPLAAGYRNMLKASPAGRAGTPDEVGDLAEFLMSSRGRFISGADFLIDGGAQSKRTWETTVDGHEGFQNIFLRKGYGVYLVDQPRIGERH